MPVLLGAVWVVPHWCRFRLRSARPRMAEAFETVETAVSPLGRDDASLTTLDLRGNDIVDAGAVALAEAVKVSATLTTLGLGGNGIGAAGAAALAEAVKVSATLTALDLRHNGIDTAACAAVAAVVARNEAFAARAPATREAAALAYLVLHAATRAAPPPNAVPCVHRRRPARARRRRLMSAPSTVRLAHILPWTSSVTLNMWAFFSANPTT